MMVVVLNNLKKSLLNYVISEEEFQDPNKPKDILTSIPGSLQELPLDGSGTK